ncbi:non-homologous end joining protein Ku, partial [Saccharomonospora iraqiensis]|uniref:non-homologous end joining protein Ku n=1 Tax=Saccharomonospora iraqiensis TaxID=52698 RepID=UPI00022E15F9
MRSVWKGTIGFGAFAVPVRAHTAVTEQSTGLTQVHTTDGGRIRYRRVCEVEDAEVPTTEIGKGVVAPNGDVVVLDEDDLAALTVPTTRSMRIHAFVPAGGIDPVRLGKSYYLEPEPEAVKPYTLLGEALRRADRVAVVKVALRQRETLGVLRPHDRVLVLDTVHWPAELRTPDFDVLDGDTGLELSRIRAAAGLIEELTTEFDTDGLDDDFSRALADLVAAKGDGSAVLRPTGAEQDEAVTRLLRALGESVGHRDDDDSAGGTAEGATADGAPESPG